MAIKDAFFHMETIRPPALRHRQPPGDPRSGSDVCASGTQPPGELGGSSNLSGPSIKNKDFCSNQGILHKSGLHCLEGAGEDVSR